MCCCHSCCPSPAQAAQAAARSHVSGCTRAHTHTSHYTLSRTQTTEPSPLTCIAAAAAAPPRTGSRSLACVWLHACVRSHVCVWHARCAVRTRGLLASVWAWLLTIGARACACSGAAIEHACVCWLLTVGARACACSGAAIVHACARWLSMLLLKTPALRRPLLCELHESLVLLLVLPSGLRP